MFTDLEKSFLTHDSPICVRVFFVHFQVWRCELLKVELVLVRIMGILVMGKTLNVECHIYCANVIEIHSKHKPDSDFENK